MIVFIQISSHLLTKIFCWLFLHIFLPRTKPPDSVALNGQPSSYSIYFEELCKYSDAKVQFTGTDISMNWVSSQISAQFSSSSSYPCSFRPSRAGGAGLLSTYLSIYLPISIYVYLYSDPPEVAVLGSGLVHASVGWTVNISCQVTHRVDICVKTVDLYCIMLYVKTRKLIREKFSAPSYQTKYAS